MFRFHIFTDKPEPQRDTTVNSLLRHHYDIKPSLDYKKLNEVKSLLDDKTVDGFLSLDSHHTSREQEKAFVTDHMPCYKPEGLFSMRIIKPDSTMKHTMLVKKY